MVIFICCRSQGRNLFFLFRFPAVLKDGDVALIRTESCERVGTYAPQGDKSGAIFAVDITHDSTYVVTAGADGKLMFYTFEGEMVKSLNHGGILKYVEFNQKPGDQTKVQIYKILNYSSEWPQAITIVEINGILIVPYNNHKMTFFWNM